MLGFRFRFAPVAAAAFVAMGSIVSTAQALVVYSSVDEENAAKILSAFTETTGVKVQMVFLSSGPALSRIEAEAGRRGGTGAVG